MMMVKLSQYTESDVEPAYLKLQAGKTSTSNYTDEGISRTLVVAQMKCLQNKCNGCMDRLFCKSVLVGDGPSPAKVYALLFYLSEKQSEVRIYQIRAFIQKWQLFSKMNKTGWWMLQSSSTKKLLNKQKALPQPSTSNRILMLVLMGQAQMQGMIKIRLTDSQTLSSTTTTTVDENPENSKLGSYLKIKYRGVTFSLFKTHTIKAFIT